MLYFLIFNKGAIDWDESGTRIGFDDAELLAGFQPQFHHVFPRKFLDGKVSSDLIDALVNIAIIGPSINIRISKQNPMDYIPKYKITPKKLAQQFISTNINKTTVKEYPEWLNQRAESLAKAGNSFLEKLRGDIHLPKVTIVDEKQEHAFEAV